MDYVGDAMQDQQLRQFVIDTLAQEITGALIATRRVATILPMQLSGRFQNPFIQHALLSIS